MAEAGVDNELIITQLKKVLHGKQEITERFEKRGLNADKLIDTISELLTAETVTKDGMPIADNDARVRGAELMAEVLGYTGSQAQQVNVLKLLMESLGLKRGGGINLNFDLTGMLYGGRD